MATVQIPISYFMDISVTEATTLTYGDPKQGLILTTGDFNPDYTVAYTSADDVGSDFGTDSNIYTAAVAYFSVTPAPETLYVGIYTDTIPATAYGGTPSSVATIQAITNGAMRITYTYEGNTGSIDLTDLDFSSATDFAGFTTVLQTAMTAAGGVLPIRYGATGFEIYGATAWPTDIASIAATAGYLTGGTSQALTSFTSVTNGGFNISIDGAQASQIRGIILGNTAATIVGATGTTDPSTLTGTDYRLAFTLGGTSYETGDIDLSSITTTTLLVAAVNTAFTTASIPATLSYDSDDDIYTITSSNKGAIAVTVCTTPTSGTDLSTSLLLDSNATATAGVAAVTTKAQVATRITSALTGATCTYDETADAFTITSSTTGTSSSIGYASAPDTGQDLSIAPALRSVLGATTTAGTATVVPDATVEALGLVSTATNAELDAEETGVLVQEILAKIYAKNTGWMILTTTKELREDYASIATYIETLSNQIYIAQDTITNPTSPSSSGICYSFYNSSLENSAAIYHSSAYEDEYLDAEMSGYLAGMRLDLENGYANMTYKTMPDITADSINATEAALFEDINGNFYGQAGFANEKVKNIIFPGKMANGTLISEKVANIVMQQRLQNKAFSAVATGNNTALGATGQAKVKSALENEIENYWKTNGYVPSDGGSYEDDSGNTVNLPKGYTFKVYTTTASRAENTFLMTGTVLKNGSVIKVSGEVVIQQST